MLEDNTNKLNIKQAIILGSGMAAMEIGSGFATGAELLQFIGSWGGNWPWIITLICFIFGAAVCGVIFVASHQYEFKNANDLYYHFFGKYVGRLVDIYVYLCLIAYTLVMIAGSGATLNQYWGLPNIVGTLGMGIVAALVACLGLRKLIDVLGGLGIFIIVVVFGIAIYTLISSEKSALEGSANVLNYVKEGSILQAGTFGIRNPIFSAFSYTGSFIMCGIAWMAAIGITIKNRKTAIVAGITSSGFFFVGCALVVYTLLVNMDAISGKQIPILAAIQNMIPVLAGPYTIIIILGIFTTATGQLFLLADRFSGGNKKRHYGIIGGTAIFAVIGSAFIPFNILVNILFSFMGFLGICVGLFIIGSYVISQMKNKGGSYHEG